MTQIEDPQLWEAKATITFTNLYLPTYAELAEIQTALQTDLPTIDMINVGQPTPDGFVLRSSGPTGLRLSISMSKVEAAWVKLPDSPPYPRFRKLAEILSTCIREPKFGTPQLAQLSYLREMALQSAFSDCLPGELQGVAMLPGQPLETFINRRLDGDMDYGIRVFQGIDRVLLLTSGGTRVKETDWMAALDKVHAVMISQFAKELNNGRPR